MKMSFSLKFLLFNSTCSKKNAYRYGCRIHRDSEKSGNVYCLVLMRAQFLLWEIKVNMQLHVCGWAGGHLKKTSPALFICQETIITQYDKRQWKETVFNEKTCYGERIVKWLKYTPTPSAQLAAALRGSFLRLTERPAVSLWLLLHIGFSFVK